MFANLRCSGFSFKEEISVEFFSFIVVWCKSFIKKFEGNHDMRTFSCLLRSTDHL